MLDCCSLLHRFDGLPLFCVSRHCQQGALDPQTLSEQVIRLSSEVEARRRFQARREESGSSLLTQMRELKQRLKRQEEAHAALKRVRGNPPTTFSPMCILRCISRLRHVPRAMPSLSWFLGPAP